MSAKLTAGLPVSQPTQLRTGSSTSSKKTLSQSPQKVLQEVFHLSHLKQPQESIITSLLEGNNTLALLPTGFGKSLCFQIPGLILPGYTLVLSPLIALMNDQVANLQKKGIPALALHSSQSLHKEEIHRFLQEKKYTFVYLSPEKLLSPFLSSLVKEFPPSLIIVDEAHCFSLWGHDFRPEYRKLPDFIHSLPCSPIPVGLFTATASKRVIEDLETSFGVNRECRFSVSFFRKNLFLSLKNFVLRSQRFLYMCYLIFEKYKNKKILIYATTRKEVETLFHALHAYNFQHQRVLDYFHAGREKREKEIIQQRYLEGKIQVLITTNAFGMGIDIPDIECVIHAQMPSCMEHFVQEIGRAGRNGGQAHCELLFHPSDLTIHENLSNNPQALQKMNEYRKKKMCHHKKIRLFFGENLSVISDQCGACEYCSPASEIFFHTLQKSLSPKKKAVHKLPLFKRTSIEQQKILFQFERYPEFFPFYLGVGKGIQEEMC